MRKLQESSIEKEKVITAYDLLERQFPGVMVLSPEDVATALGFSRKSIYGQILTRQSNRFIRQHIGFSDV